MILEEATYEAFGYYPCELSSGSRKPIVAACELCGKFRSFKRQGYHTFCMSCIQKGNTYHLGHEHTKEAKAKMGASHKGNKYRLGFRTTEETKAKISTVRLGHKVMEKTKSKISTATKGDRNHNYGKRNRESPLWKGGRKISRAKNQAKRKQQLGYTLLMPLKPGEVGHHVTNEHIIGIPKDVHQRFCGYSRGKHRTLILQWLKINDNGKYKTVLCLLAKEPLK